MCGIVGIIGRETASALVYTGLLTIQHRGQDAAGIASFDTRFHIHKGQGLVSSVFTEKNLDKLTGSMAIGQVRYPTVGRGEPEDAQPFYVNVPYGIAMVHNGNVVNLSELKENLLRDKRRRLDSNSDVEAILNVFADALMEINSPAPPSIFTAVRKVFDTVQGAYSVLALIGDAGLLAFRDPSGIRPLVMGRGPSGEYAFASESAALDTMGMVLERDIEAGEVVFVDRDGNFWNWSDCSVAPKTCIFEYVYFARPDSVIDGRSVYHTRISLGELLAEEVKKAGVEPDVVIPIPETSRPAALGLANRLGLPYREGLIKNAYIGRTFIMATQLARQSAVRWKLNPIRSEIEGKRVLLVDDSIVRGNTARGIVSLIREAGAKEIYLASFSPPVIYPCVYGIDMQVRDELIARVNSISEIEKFIGVEKLIYQSLEGLMKGVGCRDLCSACFSGNYPTQITEDLLLRIERERLASKGTL